MPLSLSSSAVRSADHVEATNLLLYKHLYQRNMYALDYVLYWPFSLILCFYLQHWFTWLFRKFCLLAEYLFKVTWEFVNSRLWQDSRRRGTWRRSPVVDVECCCKNTKGKRPNSEWHLEATIPKPKALESLQRTKQQKRKTGINHLKPISEYFVKVQTFPLTGFPEGVSCCLAAFSLPH